MAKAVTKEISLDPELITQLQSAFTRLDRLHEYCLKDINEKTFFPAVAEYFKYLVNSKMLYLAVETFVYPERQKIMAEYEAKSASLRAKLLEEYEAVKSFLAKYPQDDLRIPNCINEIEMHIDGRIRVLQGDQVLSIGHEIQDLVWVLLGICDKKLLTDIVVLDDNGVEIEWPIRAKEEKAYLEVKDDLKEQQEVALWGAFEHLATVHMAIYEGRSASKAYWEKDRWWEASAIHGMVKEMNEIKAGARNRSSSHFFERDNYLTYLNRFHNGFTLVVEDIVSAASKYNQEEAKEVAPQPIGITYANQHLIIDKKDLKITSPKQVDLCKALFSMGSKSYKPQEVEQLLKAAGYSDDDISPNGGRIPKRFDRWFYKAAQALNDRILKEVGISDIFVTVGIKQVHLNPKYQPKK